MYIYAPSKHRRSGSTMQKLKGRGMTKRFMDSRRDLDGYPKDFKFQTREEIEQYLSDDRVTCLICGKSYKTLGIHTKRIHELLADDYREKYGIPQQYPLEGKSTNEKKVVIGAAHLANYSPKPSTKKSRIKREAAPIIKREQAARIHKAPPSPGRGLPLYTDFSWHLEQVATYFNYHAIPVPQGFISWSGYKKRKLNDPQLAAAHKSARAKRPRNVPVPIKYEQSTKDGIL